MQGARVREIRDAAPAVVLDTHSKRLMNIESMLLAAWEKLDRENEIERARRSDVGYTNTDVKPFAWCDVDDAEALVLMKRPTVTYLNLEFNTITDAGLTAIAEALGESNVTALYLGGQKITDVGVVALAAALPGSKVTKLSLSLCRLTDTSGLAILRAVHVSNVMVVWLGCSGFSRKLIDDIETAIKIRQLLLLMRLVFFQNVDGDHAIIHRVARFLLG